MRRLRINTLRLHCLQPPLASAQIDVPTEFQCLIKEPNMLLKPITTGGRKRGHSEIESVGLGASISPITSTETRFSATSTDLTGSLD